MWTAAKRSKGGVRVGIMIIESTHSNGVSDISTLNSHTYAHILDNDATSTNCLNLSLVIMLMNNKPSFFLLFLFGSF